MAGAQGPFPPRQSVRDRQRRYEEARELLKECIVDSITHDGSEDEVRSCRTRLKVSWISFKDSYQQLYDALISREFESDAAVLQTAFSNFKRRTKEIADQLKDTLGDAASGKDTHWMSSVSTVISKKSDLELNLETQIEQEALEVEKLKIQLEAKESILALSKKQARIASSRAEATFSSRDYDSVFSEVSERKTAIEHWVDQTQREKGKTPPGFDEPGMVSTPKEKLHGNLKLSPHATIFNPSAIPASYEGLAHSPTLGRFNQTYVLPSVNAAQCSSAQRANTDTSEVELDASARHLALAELKKKPANPFGGDPQHYSAWMVSLKHRMEPLQLNALDILDVYEAHTMGAPRDLVVTFKTANIQNPWHAVQIIEEKLHSRFGGSEDIARSLRHDLLSFPPIKGAPGDPAVARQLRALSDKCEVVLANISTISDLQTFNESSGLEPVRVKLPDFINNKWRSTKGKIVTATGLHPNFKTFCKFLEEEADILCSDVSVNYLPTGSYKKDKYPVRVLQTNTGDYNDDSKFKCCLHFSNSHDISECSQFAGLPENIRRLMVRNFQLCFRCLGYHRAAECTNETSCTKCRATDHHTLLHRVRAYPRNNGDATKNEEQGVTLSLCSGKSGSNSGFGRTVLVDVSAPGQSEVTVKTYAILDDQSMQTFATGALLSALKLNAPICDYSIKTLANSKTRLRGKSASGLKVKGVWESLTYDLPMTLENNFIPDTVSEVATPDIVRQIPHLAHLSDNFVPLDDKASGNLLIGRDAMELMWLEFEKTPAPYAVHSKLGWATIGAPSPMHEGQRECSVLRVSTEHDHFSSQLEFPANIFKLHNDDESPGLSINDHKFMTIMHANTIRNNSGHLEMPLPLKESAHKLPQNKDAVFRRQNSTLSRLRKDKTKLDGCTSFMQKAIDAGHVEMVTDNEERGHKQEHDTQQWYIPVFPVYHPQKQKVRVVFDSAAAYNGVSLNSVLISGPDQNNRLRSVLTRMREKQVAFVADVESMFHSFHVAPEHRNFLKFFWFSNNDPSLKLTTYRSNVHVFGNTCSPAIAIYGLRKAAEPLRDSNRPADVRAFNYIHDGFYVDDGLGCEATAVDAIATLSTAKQTLSECGIKLHKIVSNNKDVLDAFPESDRNVNILCFEHESATSHRTLGVAWDVVADTFAVQVSVPTRPFTKRGVLSVINSVFDPLGICCPVVLCGKLIQRRIMSPKTNGDDLAKIGWDDPLPSVVLIDWKNWLDTLGELDQLKINRCFLSAGSRGITESTLHVFCDASMDAIGVVIYLKTVDANGDIAVAFVRAESKVAPRTASSIPRFELCAAVEATHLARTVNDDLSCKPQTVSYYTDSTVVIGYINNENRRFSKYVSRRIDIIKNVSASSQWSYITTTDNPADLATRPITSEALRRSVWFHGPKILHTRKPYISETVELAEELPEQIVEPDVNVMCSRLGDTVFGASFRRIGRWKVLVGVAQIVLSFCAYCIDRVRQKRGVSMAARSKDRCSENVAVVALIKDSQQEVYQSKHAQPWLNNLSAAHPLIKLNPIMDENGLIRVGGRLKLSSYSLEVKHPVLLPNDHPISHLILFLCHEKSFHQGRQVTMGNLRESGYYIPKAQTMARKMINNCVICRKLRSPVMQQLMADLPSDRTEPAAPFTNTGLDTIGPWYVRHGHRTRRQSGQAKMWALLFTCLVSRAVHIELLPGLDTNTFMNALRRFISVRGKCVLLRSDCGTNFVGAAREEINESEVRRVLEDLGCQWVFNPPRAQHFGGAWERKVGQLKRALNASLAMHPKSLDPDELNTLLQEAAATVNSTPLWSVSDDPNDPQPLSPSMLLHMKPRGGIGTSHGTATTNYGSRRWRAVQAIADNFWERYRKEYIQKLQVRNKWQFKRRVPNIGDIVLLKDERTTRNHWPLGIIETTKKSMDGLVRSAKVRAIRNAGKQLTFAYYERPISKLVLVLENDISC